ncbi:hypothetical protein AAEU32_11120 [Pseudoalteromonas sp. SSDWG2]|uniref:hypothetical protein n=1 Tax=Pseudoalteromonas sp. SSDWG2 TaxID=3139391 RepID=UPI003BAD80FF
MNKFILSGLLLSTAVFAEQNAYLCDSCVSIDAAKQVAKTFSPSLKCSPTFNEDIYCYSDTKNITLIDTTSGQSYSFNVHHSDVAPWPILAQEIPVNSDTAYAYREIAKTHFDLLQAIKNAQTQSTKHYDEYADTSYSNSATCPQITALTTLTDPAKLNALKSNITASIELSMSQINQQNVLPDSTSEGYSLQLGPISYSANKLPTTREQAYVVTYDDSERPMPIKDVLAFEVDILGYDSNNKPVLVLSVSDASRVAGYTLPGLRGDYGAIEVDNTCVENNLDRLTEAGIISKESEIIGGSFEPSCKLVQFYQSGKLLYRFRVCG